MVRTKAVLVVAVVDCDLDRHRSVYQTNDSGWDSDEVSVPPVRSASESARTTMSAHFLNQAVTVRKLMGECLDIISGNGIVFTRQHR